MIDTIPLHTTTAISPLSGGARGISAYQGQLNKGEAEGKAAGVDDPVFISQQGRENALAAQTGSSVSPQSGGLTQEELSQLQQLKRRDAEVRAHEQAHLSAAGQHARGGPSFSYQRGPDGNKYAIGGEVNIDISKERAPQDTIAKMQAIRRAALAPANPSAADRQIAAQASAKETQARQELAQIPQDDLLSPLAANQAGSEKAGDDSPSLSPTTFDPAVGALRAIGAYQANITG